MSRSRVSDKTGAAQTDGSNLATGEVVPASTLDAGIPPSRITRSGRTRATKSALRKQGIEVLRGSLARWRRRAPPTRAPPHCSITCADTPAPTTPQYRLTGDVETSRHGEGALQLHRRGMISSSRKGSSKADAINGSTNAAFKCTGPAGVASPQANSHSRLASGRQRAGRFHSRDARLFEVAQPSRRRDVAAQWSEVRRSPCNSGDEVGRQMSSGTNARSASATQACSSAAAGATGPPRPLPRLARARTRPSAKKPALRSSIRSVGWFSSGRSAAAQRERGGSRSG